MISLHNKFKRHVLKRGRWCPWSAAGIATLAGMLIGVWLI